MNDYLKWFGVLYVNGRLSVSRLILKCYCAHFHCKGLTETATYLKRQIFKMMENK